MSKHLFWYMANTQNSSAWWKDSTFKCRWFKIYFVWRIWQDSLLSAPLQPPNPRAWLGVLSSGKLSPLGGCWFFRKLWLLPGSFPVLTVVVIVLVAVCSGLGSEDAGHAGLLNWCFILLLNRYLIAGWVSLSSAVLDFFIFCPSFFSSMLTSDSKMCVEPESLGPSPKFLPLTKAVFSWASCLSSLGLNFLVCLREMMRMSPSLGCWEASVLRHIIGLV